VAAFIGLCTLCQLASYLYIRFFLRNRNASSPSSRLQSSDPEKKWKQPAGAFFPSAALTARRSLRRIPIAILNSYRVIAFRMNVTFFSSYTVNFAEVFVTIAYLAALFTWTFINSEYIS
jgi:hypothetical protein